MSRVDFICAKIWELSREEENSHFLAISGFSEEDVVRYHFVAAVPCKLVQLLDIALDVSEN